MEKTIQFILTSVRMLLLAAFTYFNINWDINPNYFIKFSGKKADSTFTGLKGTIDFDKNDLVNSKFDLAIDAKTIKTGNTTQDKQSKGGSWFDTEKYPLIKFVSSTFPKVASSYIVNGTFILKGVAKNVVIPFQFRE